MRFLVYMYYTHPCYQTSIFGKNCAYYIRIFTVIRMRHEYWLVEINIAILTAKSTQWLSKLKMLDWLIE